MDIGLKEFLSALRFELLEELYRFMESQFSSSDLRSVMRPAWNPGKQGN